VIVRSAAASRPAQAPASWRVHDMPEPAHVPAPTGERDTPEPAHADSFDAFYRARRTSIGRALALAIGDVDLAGDATDEAMARAYERWAMVSRLDRPEGWVYRVGLNWSVSILRRRRRSPHRLYEPAAVDGPQVADPDVRDALGALDVKHRSVVVCRHLLGWSVADTATALGVREGTVKSRLHRALQILHSRLGPLRDLEEES
jgi:RNA polymerase sigma-70 factor (ECF subfamily)